MKKKLREQLKSEKEKKFKKKKTQQPRSTSNEIINYKSFTEEQNKTLSYLDEGESCGEDYHIYEAYSFKGNLYVVYDGYADCSIGEFSKDFQDQLRSYLEVDYVTKSTN